MGRLAAVSVIVLAIVLAVMAACSDGTGPRPTGNSVGLIVSAPVHPLTGAAAHIAAPVVYVASASASVVYVSLPPESVPGGLRATITNQATGQSVTTDIVTGGFDPVPLAANVGNTVVVDITGTASFTPVRVRLNIAPDRPPQPVRTSPPSGGRDVPLNSIIVVVFSDPIDPATLTTGSVQLLRDATPVEGAVTFADSSHLRVEFHPASLLTSQTAYRLHVSTAIRDVNGVALISPLDVPFTAGTTGAPTGLVFASVSEGQWYTCGVTTSGAAYCWGTNWAGQLGNDTTLESHTPVPVTGGLSFVALSAGAEQVCGVTRTGAAYCWGNLGYGDKPLDSATLSACNLFWWCPRPVPVPGGVIFTAVSAGDTQRCGITTTGAAYCWGNGWGPLGFAGDTTFSSIPIVVPGGLSFAAVSAGGVSDCGVTTTGDAYCWGTNSAGQLGNGSTAMSSVPVKVSGGLIFKTVSAGQMHACGVTTTGAAYCWGDNSEGELGDGTTTSSLVPVAVTGGHIFATISTNDGTSTCGVTTDASAYCWGSDSLNSVVGFIGGPPTVAPVVVAGGVSFAMVAPGSGSHRCGLSASGAAYCWGLNMSGELGDGTTTNSAVPVKVAGQR